MRGRSPETLVPTSTPVKPYRFSDHIHRDRHIFLKGASIGIGCGSDISDGNSLQFPHERSNFKNLQQLSQDYNQLGQRYSSEGQVPNDVRMTLRSDRLPSLHRVHLALSSADLARQRHVTKWENPHVHPQQQVQPARRPFNEQLNTYIDTQKRIRSVHCLEDLYSEPSSPILPFLAASSPRAQKQRAAGRFARSDSILQISTKMSKVATPVDSSVVSNSNVTSAGTSLLPMDGVPDGSSGTVVHQAPVRGRSFTDIELALAEARAGFLSLKRSLHASTSSLKESGHTTTNQQDGKRRFFGRRMFENYPKRVFVHPGRILRQQTDLYMKYRPDLY